MLVLVVAIGLRIAEQHAAKLADRLTRY